MSFLEKSFPDINRIHFIGIGGAGTAPLAHIMLQRSCNVSGSDLVLNDKIHKLIKEGACINKGHCEDNLPDDAQLLVFSSAAAKDNPEMLKAEKLGIPCIRRGNFLAVLAASYKRTFAVSGSHGKTTITAMLSWILRNCAVGCGYLIGGKVNDFPESEAGNGDIFVTEVDESDGTHAAFSPALGIVSNVEDDHSWSVGGTSKLMDNFKNFARQSKKLIYVEDDNSSKLFNGHLDSQELKTEDLLALGEISFNGFMRLDAALACIAASEAGIDFKAAVAAVNNFPGVARRMTVHAECENTILIEDYAHHPTEVARSIELLRQNYPDWHLRVVFQPHRYARLAKYVDDFANELRKADSVFIVPVFAAWTETGEVESKDLADKIGDKAENLDMQWNEMPDYILRERPENLLIAVLGAGDVEKIIPELKLEL